MTGDSPLILQSANPSLTIGSDTGAFLSTTNAAHLRNFTGGLSIGGSIPNVSGATQLLTTNSSIVVSEEFRTSGDLALVGTGNITVAPGGLLGSDTGTLTVAAGIGQSAGTGNISDPGGGRFFFDAPEVVLIANGTVGTPQNPLTILSSPNTVSVGSGTGAAFLDGLPGGILASGPLIQDIFNTSGGFSNNVLNTSVFVTDADTVPQDVAQATPSAVPPTEEEEPARQDYNVARLLSFGPQLPRRFSTSQLSVTGLVRAGWPILFSYRSSDTGVVRLTVTAEGVAPFVFQSELNTGARESPPLTVPERFGGALVPAVFRILAIRDPARDSADPASLEIIALGAGPKAIGSEAIEQIHFLPPLVRANKGEVANYRFYSRSHFERVSTEFMKITRARPKEDLERINELPLEGGVKENTWVGDKKPREWNGKARTDLLSPGQHRLQIRAWVDEAEGGDWITAWSDSVVDIAP